MAAAAAPDSSGAHPSSTTCHANFIYPSVLQAALAAGDNEGPEEVFQIYSSCFTGPLLPLKKPSLWPGADAPETFAQVAWIPDALLALFHVHGPFLPARDDPQDKKTILKDSRVEVFIAPRMADTQATGNGADEHAAESFKPIDSYTSYEMNSAGRALDFKVQIPKMFNLAWKGGANLLHSWTRQDASSSSSPSTTTVQGDQPSTTFMLLRVPFFDFCDEALLKRIVKFAPSDASTTSNTGSASNPNDDVSSLFDQAFDLASSSTSCDSAPSFHLGLYRGEASLDKSDMTWSSWIDVPSENVDFHVPISFGVVHLSPPQEEDLSRITDDGCVWQGSMLSLEPQTILRHGFTHVVNAAGKEIKPRTYAHVHVQRCDLLLDDSLGANLFNIPASGSGADAQNIIDAFRFMSGAVQNGGRVLVHCAQGISRSSAVVLFFLMKSRQMHVDDALPFLQSRRSVAKPNQAFMSQLRSYCGAEEILRADRTDL